MKPEMKKTLSLVLLGLVIWFSMSACDGSRGSRGGDGVNTCRNCGREKKLVAGFGYCSTCYGGFIDWQENNWKDD